MDTPEEAEAAGYLAKVKAVRLYCRLDRYIDDKGVALVTEIKQDTLRKWRRINRGPPWQRTKRIEYDVYKLAAWVLGGGNKK